MRTSAILLASAVGFFGACGGSSDSFSHDDVAACLRDQGLMVGEGGRLSGKPAIAVEGGSALIVVFDSSGDAQSEAEDPSGFFSSGETDARGNAFVYFAPGASQATRGGINTCVPEQGS